MEPPPPYSEIDPSLNAEAAKPSVIVTQPTSIHGDVPPSATELGETEQHDDRIPFHLSNAAAGPSRASAMFPVEDEEENKKKKKEIPNNGLWNMFYIYENSKSFILDDPHDEILKFSKTKFLYRKVLRNIFEHLLYLCIIREI